MTGKGWLVSMVSGNWVAPLTLAAALTPGASWLACPDGAPPLCEMARASLAEAQTAVDAAAARRALWSTAADALREARGAFGQGDYQAARQAAAIAIEQARMGIAQTAYPMFPFPSY